MSETVKFQVGEVVARVTDEKTGIVTAIIYRKSSVEYLVRWDDSNDEVFSYDFEMTVPNKTFS